MNHNILKAMDFLSGKRKDKSKKEAADTKERVNDLFIKFYEYNPEIQIPIPTLWAIAKINEYFGSQDKINFDDVSHIGRLLFILHNQHNDKAIYYSKDEIEREIRQILSDIPAPQMEAYQKALFEMFLALKKNSLRRTKDILLQARAAFPTD